MAEFFTFAMFILLGVMLLVVWPILAHPTLPIRRKLLLSIVSFIILVPLGIGLYLWLGVPQLAGNS